MKYLSIRLTIRYAIGLFTGLLSTAGLSPLLAQRLQQTSQIGGPGYSDVKGMETDSQGNVYLLGTFFETVDFDPSPTAQTLSSGPNGDLFVAKYNAAGELLFVKQILVNTTGDDITYPEDIAVDASGNIFVSVSFQGNITVEATTLTSTLDAEGGNSRDIMWARYNADGPLSFAYRLGGPGTEYGYELTTTPDGKVLLVGRFQEEIDVDPTEGQRIIRASDNSDIFIARYNADGTSDAAVSFGGEDFQSAASATVDTEGNVIIAGSYRNSISLDPTSSRYRFSNPGTRNGFIAKYDRDLAIQFATPLLLPQNDAGESLEISTFIQTDAANNILVTGRFAAQIDVGGQVLNAAGNGVDIFLAKYQPDGSPVFARRYGGTDFEESRDVATDQEGNLYLLGNFRGELDFGGSVGENKLNNSGEDNGFLAKLNAQGEYINVQELQSEGKTMLKRLARPPGGLQTLIMAGGFEQNLVLSENVSLTSQGDYDMVVARYDITQSPGAAEPVSLDSLSAYEGVSGITLTLFGANFSSILEENEVLLGETAVVPTSVSETGTELTIVVPVAVVPGSYEVSVNVGGASDRADRLFTVLEAEGDAPTLVSLSANDGQPGDTITLSGSGFVPESVVNFGTSVVAIERLNSTGTLIAIVVPEQPSGEYFIFVTTRNGTTASLSFQISEPGTLSVQSLSVYVGQAGDEVLLRGANFGETIEDNAVTFAETPVEVVRVNAERTELTVRVPNVTPGTYPVSLDADGQRDTADRPFLVDIYCTSSAQQEAGIRIEQVRLQETTFVAQEACAAYTNFTNQAIPLTIGNTAFVSVTVGTCSEDEPKAVGVFVDWNGDQDFDDEGERVATSPSLVGTTTYETEISVPRTAPVDVLARLRVVLSPINDLSLPVSISACGLYATGETQDFSVQLAAPLPLITAVSPAIIEANTSNTLVISGENFGDAVDSILVLIGDVPISTANIQVNGTGTQITVVTPPLASGQYPVQVSIGDETVTAEGITVTDEPVTDQEPPVIVYNAPGLLEEGERTFAVSGEVRDGSPLTQVTLEFLAIRKDPLGAGWRRVDALREGETDTYIAQLRDTDLDELGVQTRMIARDEVGNSDTSAIEYTFRRYGTASPLRLERVQAVGAEATPASYNLVSVPLEEQSASQVFGELGPYDRQRWRLWRLQGDGLGQEAYQEYGSGWDGDLEAGRGYMLIYRQAADFQTTGRVVEASYGSPYQVRLLPGFNMVGNPYPFALNWGEVLEYNGLSGAALRMKTFSGSFQESERWEAFQGALVVNASEGAPITLSLPVGTVPLTEGGRAHQLPLKPADGWQAVLTLSVEGLSTRAIIGMHPEAQPGFDRYDDVAPPRLADAPVLSSFHPEFFIPKFSQDIVPPALEHAWLWEVQAQPHQLVTLHWKRADVSLLSQPLTLVDEQGDRSMDMNQHDRHTFRVNESGNYTLKVLYAAPERLNDLLEVQTEDGYPNPVTDRWHLPIRLPLGKRTTVYLEVLDATGRQVDRQVYRDLLPGPHTLTWERNGFPGSVTRSLPSGLYLFRLQTSDTQYIVNQQVLLK